MTDRSPRGTDAPMGPLRATVAVVVALAVLAVGLVAVAPTASAQESGGYVVEQGDRCIEVDPISGGDRTVEEFYDYRNEDTEPSSDSYSSFGTVAYQEDNTSHLMIYEGSDGVSLVVVHEQYHANVSEGSKGGNAALTFSGLPSDSEWAVKDDHYENQSDEYEDSGSTKSAEWWYDRSRTDGAAIRGVAGADSITVEPSFNENTWSGSYGGLVHEWKVITSTGDGVERASLEMDAPITVRPGTCGEGDANDPDADLEAPEEAAVEETVTLDASGSETGPDPTYEWFVDGESVGDGPTHETAFSETGTYDLRVEVTDGNGTGAEEATIDIYDEPTADFAVRPASPEAGEQVTFDGNESVGDVARYEWDFGDGATAEGETATNVYEEAGTYEVTLTVTDESGRQDTRTRTVEVAATPGPNASLQVPETARTDETVTLDASGSETGPDPTYEWYVDSERVAGADGPTLETSFADPGSHRVRVSVTDDDGSDSAGGIVEVRGEVEANADASPTEVETGESVTFDGADSTGDVDSYRWNLGDGTTVSGLSPSYSYDYPGTYLVELVVESTDGRTSRDTVEVTVEEPSEDAGEGSGGDGDGNDSAPGSDGVVVTATEEPPTSDATATEGPSTDDATATDEPPTGDATTGTETATATDADTYGSGATATDDDSTADGTGPGGPTAILAGVVAVLLGRRRLR